MTSTPVEAARAQLAKVCAGMDALTLTHCAIRTSSMHNWGSTRTIFVLRDYFAGESYRVAVAKTIADTISVAGALLSELDNLRHRAAQPRKEPQSEQRSERRRSEVDQPRNSARPA